MRRDPDPHAEPDAVDAGALEVEVDDGPVLDPRRDLELQRRFALDRALTVAIEAIEQPLAPRAGARGAALGDRDLDRHDHAARGLHRRERDLDLVELGG